ncbi:MAG: Sua5/YciO/YrdC/YwlC family protein [Methylococcales bacterium]
MKGRRSTPCRQQLRAAIRHLGEGGVIAYPTEAVFGLGCDPDNIAAIETILKLKDRPVDKGLILIASEFDQLLPYVDLSDIPDLNRVLKTWPGPTTWLMKARSTVPSWLRGAHESIAVRVTAHPLASELSRAFGKPLVSTSANPAGCPPAKSATKTRLYFGHANLLIVKGEVGEERKPTAIFDAWTRRRLR